MRRHLAIASALACAVAAPAARAQTATIKLGTLAPEGSSWHVALKEMGERWSQASDGKVKLKIFPSGVAGNEGDMVRKMRVGQLQSAALTVVGLHDIVTACQVIAAPGLIDSQEEWNHVFGKMTPRWERRFTEKGFTVLLWADTGWTHLFSKRQFKAPGELRGVKTFAWSGDPSSVEAMKLSGFQPVVLSSTDILPSLSTGMIEALVSTPVMAMTARFYDHTPYMTESAWGHLPGAIVVASPAWEKVPAEVREKLGAIAREAGKKIDDAARKMDEEAIATMKKNGLTVVEFDEAGKKAWQAMGEAGWPAVRGGVATAADFDEVKALRDQFRAEKK